jgi:hypothetical protein
LAILLLERSTWKENSLIGDLVEEFNEGRSRQWFWRQTLFAIATVVLRDLRQHPLIIVRGLAVSWMCGFLVGAGVRAIAMFTTERILRRVMPLEVFLGYQVGPITGIVFGFATSVLMGWVVAASHQRQRVATILTTLAVFLPFSTLDAHTHRVWQNATIHWQFMQPMTFFSHLFLQIAGIIVWPFGMVVGGIILPIRSLARASSSCC